MSVAIKYNLGESLLKVMTDPSAAIVDLHNLALELKGKVEEIDKAAAGTDAGEKVNPLEAKYGKDEDGKNAAESFLKAEGGPFYSIVEYIDEDPGRTFHVLNAVSDLLVKYLRSESEYFKMELTPKAAKASRKGEYKSDFNEVRELIVNVAGMAQAAGWVPADCELLEESSQAGKYRSILKGFRGTKTADDGTVTGRYAKVYSLAWNIDGEDIDTPWTIPDIVRCLWHGPERIGKNTKSLTEILDIETKWADPKFTGATFTVNGHKVVVTRTVTED